MGTWYVDVVGKMVWVDASETVYTVTTAADDLPVHTLTYLAVSSKKAIYAEHAVQDDIGDKKGKKEQAGKQRGFIVMVEQVESSSVNANFSAAAGRLHDLGLVSRIDCDEVPGERRRKKRGKAKVEDAEADDANETQEALHIDLATLGENECRVETMARCNHQAHGPGFRVEIAEDNHRQVLHMFTAKQELALPDWLGHLADAIRSTGSRVMDSKCAASLVPTDDRGNTLEGGAVGAQRFNEAQAETAEEDWLSSMMGLGGAPVKESRAVVKAANKDDEEGKEGEESKKAEEKELPPWLQKKPSRARRAQKEEPV